MIRVRHIIMASLMLLVPQAPFAAVVQERLPGGVLEGELDGLPVPLPLLKSNMVAHIHGDIATVELTQTFTNPLTRPMHGRYIFPLPPNAAVYAMRLMAGDQVIEAEIRRKEQAEQEYEEAKSQGKQAALLTQHRPNVFTQQVANLMPGVPIRVELHYAHTVPKVEGAFQFHFPLVVGPRYLPGKTPQDGDPSPLKVGQWNLPASPPVALPDVVDPERVSIAVELQAGLPITQVDSQSHTLEIHAPSPDRRSIRLAEGRTIDNQDFVLRYSLEGDSVATGVTTYAQEGKRFLSLLIEPPAQAPPQDLTPREMVFVLDCSGSMHGTPMAASKRFMRQALTHLRPTDSFRLISFSHVAKEFGLTPLPATPGNIQAGLTFIETLEGQGGTEMITGIRAALSPPAVPGAIRIVVFLTDGYVGNDVEIVRLIQQIRGEARLFSFGVGTAVNRYLLEEMARAGRGMVRYVRPEEDAEDVAGHLAEQLGSPYLTDIEIDWGEAPVREATPARLADLFLGQSLRVLARYGRPGEYRITVKGRVAGRPVSLPLDVTLPDRDPLGQALEILWARGQVEDRMLDYLAPSASADVQQALQEEVTVLGLEHRLVTQWTSFVAVAKEVVNPGGVGAQADVAVAQVKGVSATAYPAQAFSGSSAPEPAEWAAILLLMALAGWRLRRRAML